MTVKELLDVYDRERDHNGQWLRFVDGNFDTTAKIASSSDFLNAIEDEEIDAIGVYKSDEITVWLKDWDKKSANDAYGLSKKRKGMIE